MSDRLDMLKEELKEMEDVEADLDEQRNRVQQSIRNVTDDQENSRYPFHLNLNYIVGKGYIKPTFVVVEKTMEQFQF